MLMRTSCKFCCADSTWLRVLVMYVFLSSSAWYKKKKHDATVKKETNQRFAQLACRCFGFAFAMFLDWSKQVIGSILSQSGTEAIFSRKQVNKRQWRLLALLIGSLFKVKPNVNYFGFWLVEVSYSLCDWLKSVSYSLCDWLKVFSSASHKPHALTSSLTLITSHKSWSSLKVCEHPGCSWDSTRARLCNVCSF